MKHIVIVSFLVLTISLSIISQYASATVYDGTKAGIMLTFEHATSDQLIAIDANMTDMVGTMGPLSERVGTAGHLTQQQLLDLQARGFEIASHSASHEQISDSTSPSTLNYEILQSKIDLENMGFEINGYVWPFNKVTNDAFDLVKDNYSWTNFHSPIPYQPFHMTLETLDYSLQTFGVYHEESQGLGNGYEFDSFSKAKDEIDYAIANNFLIGFKLHRIETGSDDQSTSPTMFNDIIDYLREQRDLGHLDVLTRTQGLGFEDEDTTAPTTTASPSGGTFTPVIVTLTPNDDGITYYTLDGSIPTTSSELYTIPILISDTTTLKFFTVDTDENVEIVKTEVYTISESVPSDITFVNSNNTQCILNPCSLPITLDPGNDRMIIVVVSEEGILNPVTSIDITGGISQGIQVGSEQIGSGSTETNVEMWRIMEADISDGANTVTVNFPSIPSDAAVSLMHFTGVKQQPEETMISNSIESNPTISAEINTLSDSAVIISSVGIGEGGGSYTSHGADQIERHDFAVPSAGQAVTTEFKETAGLDTQAHTYSTSTNRQAQVAASFAPAPGIIDTIAPITTAFQPGGVYTSTQLVDLTSNETALIYYTLDGTLPTLSSSIFYATIPISVTTTLNYFGVDAAGNMESVKTEVYSISTLTPSFDIDDDGILDEFDTENIIDSSTTLSTSHIVVANITIQDGALLTIPNGITLDIDFTNFNLTIESGSGVLIQSGGTIT